jgi:hypothetical protein
LNPSSLLSATVKETSAMGFRPGSVLSESHNAQTEFRISGQAVCCQSEDGVIKQPLHSNQVISSSDSLADHPERVGRVTPRVRNDANKFEDGCGVAEQAISPLDSLSLNGRPLPMIKIKQVHRIPPPSAIKKTKALLRQPPALILSTSGLELPIPTSAGSSHLILQQGRPISPSRSVASSPPSPAPPSQAVAQREHFLIFIKILFKCLDQANEPDARDKAKKIVAECTRRNRQGDSNFTPLMEAVEKRLRGFVGEVQWGRALLLLRHYVNKRNNDTIKSSPEASSSTA